MNQFFEKRFAAVLAVNRELQRKAREYNLRAGETVFDMTAEFVKERIKKMLCGATCKAEIRDPNILRLPALRADLIDTVLKMNPSTVEILGQTYPVEYPTVNNGLNSPKVKLGDEFISNNRWLELPDDGVKLPGGRLVNIVLKPSTSWSSLAEGSDVPALKQAMKNRLNTEQWNNFIRPVITVPTEIADETALPEITTVTYGTCVVTGESLNAYGTLTAHRYYSWNPITWKPEWFRVRAEVEAAFSKAQAELEKAKVEARDRRECEAVQKAAEAAKSRVRDLYGEHCSYSSEVKLEGELRDRLYSLYYAYLPSDLTELREWTAQTNALVAEVEAAVADGKRKHEEKMAEDARLQAEAEKQFGSIPEHLLSAFSGNKATTLAFMQKVAKLPKARLSEHVIVSCGRGKRQDHLIEVSGDPEFFMGADPNDVCWYIANVHFYNKYAQPAVTRVESAKPAPVAPAKPAPAPPVANKSFADQLASQWGARRK